MGKFHSDVYHAPIRLARHVDSNEVRTAKSNRSRSIHSRRLVPFDLVCRLSSPAVCYVQLAIRVGRMHFSHGL